MNAQRGIEMRQTLTTKVYNEFLRFAKKHGLKELSLLREENMIVLITKESYFLRIRTTETLYQLHLEADILNKKSLFDQSKITLIRTLPFDNKIDHDELETNYFKLKKRIDKIVSIVKDIGGIE